MQRRSMPLVTAYLHYAQPHKENNDYKYFSFSNNLRHLLTDRQNWANSAELLNVDEKKIDDRRHISSLSTSLVIDVMQFHAKLKITPF